MLRYPKPSAVKQLTVVAALSVLLVMVFGHGLQPMVAKWAQPEYNHAYFIPLLTLYLIYHRRSELASLPASGSWWGFAMAVCGLLLAVAGELSTLYVLVQYAFVLTLIGLVLALVGPSRFKIVAGPLAFLLFMVPLPNFLYQGLSAQLQLVSSQIGVEVIRLFGVPVYLEGNVVDLGAFKLQVVEACSGLRYLFPLLSIGFLCAYLFQGAWWKRLILFLSSIPITVLMNSLRIGITGVLVEHWGVQIAQGFLHDFEGFVVFAACVAILVAEMAVLARIGTERRGLGEVFRLSTGVRAARQIMPVARRGFYARGATVGVLLVVALLNQSVHGRVDLQPQRRGFEQFPAQIGAWRGSDGRLEPVYLDVLQLDDYLLADYRDDGQRPVNLYVAYYASQRSGASAHSPRSCLPGGGWHIRRMTQQSLAEVESARGALRVNRLEIQQGQARQLVYYWFQQRGRQLTNEYLVKWYLFWDALTRQRTDGALIRLTTIIGPNEDWDAGDTRLRNFAGQLAPLLDQYVPA